MPSVSVFDVNGKKVSDIDLADGIFGIEPNTSAMHLVVVNYLANQRQGTQSALTRAEVSGGGRKPWRQKGTGRARQGSTRAAQWIKGGIIFAPKPRDYGFSVNKKVKAVAMRSALSAKVLDNEIVVIDKLELADVKTKSVVNMLKDLGVEGRALIVTCDKNDNLYLSARNIYGVEISYVGMLNVYEIMKAGKLIIAQNAVEKLEEVYA
ncbi:MAG: 50S ribosomal protein L4 [Oscillospiraceae bacterium]|nr:50S ribosomal protein L4 [Oscillospiraceae bacterium]